jgi:two-component system chemotaxis response regulator CheY
MSVDTLIVDDSALFRRVLQSRLENIGCRIVAQADNSSDGLELFRAHNPQLVTLDLMMPNPDDFGPKELFSSIRSESPKTAIVIISVHLQNANASAFLADGALAYIEKSFMDFSKIAVMLRKVFPELAIA